MKKLKNILSSVLVLGVVAFSYAQKPVKITNMSENAYLIVSKITTQAHIPGEAGQPFYDNVYYGYSFDVSDQHTISGAELLIPPGQTLDLSNMVSGSYNSTSGTYPDKSFPFGWNHPSNPFYGKVYHYQTIGGEDLPYGSPMTLPVDPDKILCVKEIEFTFGYLINGVFQKVGTITQSTSDGASVSSVTNDGGVMYSKYFHKPISPYVYPTPPGTCVRDTFTTAYID